MRGNVEDMERVLGSPARAVVIAGGGASTLAPLLAQVLGRDITLAGGDEGARGGIGLVTAAQPPDPDRCVLPAGDPAPFATGYARFRRAHAVLRSQLPESEEDL